MKATERAKRIEGGKAVSFRLERADLRTWLVEPMPVILCVYDVAADVAYWLYVRRHFKSQPGFDLFTIGATVTVHIPISQVIDPAAVGSFAGFLAEVQQQIQGKISHV